MYLGCGDCDCDCDSGLGANIAAPARGGISLSTPGATSWGYVPPKPQPKPAVVPVTVKPPILILKPTITTGPAPTTTPPVIPPTAYTPPKPPIIPIDSRGANPTLNYTTPVYTSAPPSLFPAPVAASPTLLADITDGQPWIILAGLAAIVFFGNQKKKRR